MHAAPLTLVPLDRSDDRQVAAYAETFTAVWPEFATTLTEFRHELSVREDAKGRGAAMHWLVRGATGDNVGTLSVERVIWNQPTAPPMVLAALDPGEWSEPAYRRMLEAAALSPISGGHDEIRVLVWDREELLTDILRSLDGWRSDDVDVDVALDVATADVATVELPEGYAIVTLADRPELERGAWECLRESTLDIPGGEAQDMPEFDVWCHVRRTPAHRDDSFQIAVAPDGTVAGIAELEFLQGNPELVWHGFTGVRRAHRGRGIATALKRATIAYARDNGIKQLRTENEERNAGMRSINRRLGYVQVATRAVLRGPRSRLLTD